MDKRACEGHLAFIMLAYDFSMSVTKKSSPEEGEGGMRRAPWHLIDTWLFEPASGLSPNTGWKTSDIPKPRFLPL